MTKHDAACADSADQFTWEGKNFHEGASIARVKTKGKRQEAHGKRQKGKSERQPTHETEEGQVGDDGLHHLAPSIPPWLVAITLTGTMTIVIICIRQVTNQEYSLCIIILQQVYSQPRSEGKGLMKCSLVVQAFKRDLTRQMRQHTIAAVVMVLL